MTIIVVYRHYHLNADSLFKKYNHSIALIETYDKKGEPIALGSGIIISNDGLILTNNHVIKNAYSGMVTLKAEKADSEHAIDAILRTDELYDLATIKIESNTANAINDFRSESFDKIGEKVYCIGNPAGLTNTLSEGIISSIRTDKTFALIQSTAPISQGSSGGAMFNSRGELIGITTIMMENAQNINFAIPIKYALNQIFGYKYIDKNQPINAYEVLSFLNTEKQIIDDLKNSLAEIDTSLTSKLNFLKESYGYTDKKAVSILYQDKKSSDDISSYLSMKKTVDDRVNIYNTIYEKYSSSTTK